MKKLLLIILIPALSFMVSCGGSDGDGIMSQMKKMKEVADNAKEMQEDMESHPEDSEALFTDHRLDQLGITNTENKISADEWSKAQKIVNDFKALDSAELVNLTHEKIAAIYSDHGYASVEEGQAEMEKIGNLSQNLIEWGMHIAATATIQMINGKEAAEKEMKEYGAKINEQGYSREDLKNMEKNTELVGEALAVFFTFQNYSAIHEITAVADSLNQLSDSLQQLQE